MQASGFPPLLGNRAVVLILGSMPGQASLQARQYYAHPRNAFWPLMGRLFDIDPQASYETRTRLLVEQGVAVWDVLASCIRPGSLDSAIDQQSIKVNDFSGLFSHATDLTHIFFNGTTAETLYRRHVLKAGVGGSMTLCRLPSTSPAHASMTFDTKLTCWQAVLAPLDRLPE